MSSFTAADGTTDGASNWGDVARHGRIIAHRGAAGLWPENSLVAFTKALGNGYRAFEIDVHGTSDRDLVVIHDLTVDRTSDGSGAVRDLSTADLGRLHLNGTNGESIPHLNDVLQLFRSHRAVIIVEIKFRSDVPEHDDLCKRLADALTRAEMGAATSVSAFDWKSLARLKRLDAAINLNAVASTRGLADRGGLAATVAAAIDLGACDLSLEWNAVDEATAHTVHAAGLRLGVWTPNTTDEIVRMISYGVDWIITDRPDLAPASAERLSTAQA